MPRRQPMRTAGEHIEEAEICLVPPATKQVKLGSFMMSTKWLKPSRWQNWWHEAKWTPTNTQVWVWVQSRKMKWKDQKLCLSALVDWIVEKCGQLLQHSALTSGFDIEKKDYVISHCLRCTRLRFSRWRKISLHSKALSSTAISPTAALCLRA